MTHLELQKVVLQICYDLQQLGRPFDWILEDLPNEKWPPIRSLAELAEICEKLQERKLINCRILRSGNRVLSIVSCQIEPRGIRVCEGEEEFPTSTLFPIIDNSVKITGSPAAVVQTGQHNSQTIIQDFRNHVEQISKAIENSNASEISKNEVRSLFGEFLKHPLVTSIAGGLAARAY
jgi:hypothetical protein